jgi:hypothetical protein
VAGNSVFKMLFPGHLDESCVVLQISRVHAAANALSRRRQAMIEEMLHVHFDVVVIDSSF